MVILKILIIVVGGFFLLKWTIFAVLRWLAPKLAKKLINKGLKKVIEAQQKQNREESVYDIPRKGQKPTDVSFDDYEDLTHKP